MADGERKGLSFRLRRPVVLAAAGGILVFLAFLVTSLPPVSNALVAAALNARGLGPAKVEGAYLGLFGTRIHSLRLGEGGAIEIDEVDAAYTPWGLIGGQVRIVKIQSVSARARFRNGSLELPVRSSAGGPAGEFSLPELPPIEIVLLRLELDGLDAPLAVIASVSAREAAGRQSIALAGDLFFAARYGLKADLSYGDDGGAALAVSLQSSDAPVPEEFQSAMAPPLVMDALSLDLEQSDGLLTTARARLSSKAAGRFFGAEFAAADMRLDLAVPGQGSAAAASASQLALSARSLRMKGFAAALDEGVADPGSKVSGFPLGVALADAFGALAAGAYDIETRLPIRVVTEGGLLNGSFALLAPEENAIEIGAAAGADARLRLGGAGADGLLAEFRIAPEFVAEILPRFSFEGAGLSANLGAGRISLASRQGPESGNGMALSIRSLTNATLSIISPTVSLGVSLQGLESAEGADERLRLSGLRLTADGALMEGFSSDGLALDLSGTIDRKGAVTTFSADGECLSIAARRLFISELGFFRSGIKACGDAGKPFVVYDAAAQTLAAAGSYALSADAMTYQSLRATGVLPAGPYALSARKGSVSVIAGVAAGPLVIDPGSAEARVHVTDVTADSTLTMEEGAIAIRWPSMRARITDTATLARFAPVGVTGAMALEDGLLRGSWRASALNRNVAEVQLRHEIGSGRGGLSLDTDEIKFSRKGLKIQELLPIFRGVFTGAEGSIRADARFDWRRSGRLRSVGALTFGNFGATTRYGRIDGVNGRFALSDLLPFTTVEPQIIRIKSVDIGLPLADGEVMLAMPGNGTLEIPSARWPWSGGHLSIVEGVLNPQAETQKLAMTAEAIDLTQIFRLLNIAGLEGSGVVDGRLPIEIRGSDAFLVNGEFKARSGGVLKYTGEAAAAAAQGGEGASLLFAALENFIYDTLVISVDGRMTGIIIVKLKLMGHNPKLYDGYPFELNVSIESELANLLLQSTEGLRLPEKIERTLTGGE